MAHILNYVIVNDIIQQKPEPLLREVFIQSEIEDIRTELYYKHKLDVKNAIIESDLMTTRSKYQILFTLRQHKHESLNI